MSETPPLSIGEQLRQAREARKLSLDQAAYQTHIKLHYLSALESDEASAFPSQAQARGFLRTYANYLDLDATLLIGLLDGERAPSTPKIAPKEPKETTAPSPSRTEDAGDANFVWIGQHLRNQRELLGLSLEDVERHSHIRAHYLDALENGRLDDLPSPVQGRGMLTNYANFLGLDPEPLLMRYADGLQERLSFRQRMAQPKARISPNQEPSRRRRLPLDWLISLLVIGILFLFLGWGAIRVVDMTQKSGSESNSPSIADILSGGQNTPSPSPTNQVTPSPAPAGTLTLTAQAFQGATTATPEPATPTPNNAPVQVYIIAQSRGWMRVIVDGELEFQGRTMAGNTYPYSANESIELRTGNGAALRVIFNQNDLGVLGTLGEVVERVFTVSGVQLPTATITPTPPPATDTPVVTPTSTPTPAP